MSGPAASTALQVAALCHQRDGAVLLVTSRGTGRWVLPKGWPMPGRTLAEAAAQEAWEEAGVRGRVGGTEIGRYHYDKLRDSGLSIPVEVVVFPLQVETLARRYPEAHQRQRRWMAVAEAAAAVDETGLRAILAGLPAGARLPRRA